MCSAGAGVGGGQATPDASARTVEHVRLASAVCTDCAAREFRVSTGEGCAWSGARWPGWLTDDVVLWAQRSQLNPVPVHPEAFDHDMLDVHRRCSICGVALQHATPGGKGGRVYAHERCRARAPRLVKFKGLGDSHGTESRVGRLVRAQSEGPLSNPPRDKREKISREIRDKILAIKISLEVPLS